MVFYRKYRSQKIEELDSANVRDTLYSVLKNPPHAFLFTGPKGLGKTSTARIVAKAVNCDQRSKIKDQRSKPQRKAQSSEEAEFATAVEPCNKCEECVSITNGTNMDVMEIDAASNRGIDEIRDLREKIWLAPLKAHKKVYIIDEVHMLTTEAFNALLKTLEEPPEHAMFVLCTTEPQKIPATIHSRCFHIEFKRATTDEIMRSLKRITKGEDLEIDDEPLRLIAQRAEGGFRDATKILEEISLLAKGKKITAELIEEKYHASSTAQQVLSMFEALTKRDAKIALEIIERLVHEGIDIKYFLQQAIEFLHEQLLEQAGVKDNFKFQISNFKFSIVETKILFELFSKAYGDMRYAVLPQLPLELAVIEFINLSPSLSSAGAGLQPGLERSGASLKLAPAEDDGEKPGDITVAPTIEKLRREANNNLKTQAVSSTTKNSESRTKNKEEVVMLQLPASGDVTADWLDVLWKSIIAEMKKYNHTIAGVLRSCQIGSYDKKLLVISTGYKFHKERLDDPLARAELKKVCKALTGNEVEIEVELKRR